MIAPDIFKIILVLHLLCLGKPFYLLYINELLLILRRDVRESFFM
jgi:hypothetical protein